MNQGNDRQQQRILGQHLNAVSLSEGLFQRLLPPLDSASRKRLSYQFWMNASILAGQRAAGRNGETLRCEVGLLVACRARGDDGGILSIGWALQKHLNLVDHSSRRASLATSSRPSSKISALPASSQCSKKPSGKSLTASLSVAKVRM
jgi:hypothetical protein